MRKMFLLMIVGSGVIVLLSAAHISAQPPRGKKRWGPRPAAVVLSPVVEKNIRRQITSIGTVEARIATTVSAEIQGLTNEFKLQEGDRVEKGKTILVRLKNSGRRIDLAEADAAHRRAQAQLEKLKRGLRKEEIEEVRAQLKERNALMQKYQRDMERAGELLRSKIINLSEYNRTESDFLAAKYQVQRLEQSLRLAQMGTRREDIAGQEAEVQRQKANLDRMRDELAKTIIRAPISGFITKKHVEVGQWIQRGGAVADIINIDTVLVRTGVRERDIRHVQVGDNAVITVDAYPGTTFRGKVRDIIPQADVASRSFPVKIEIANPNYRLKGGMFARVKLFYGEKRPTLMVPKDALSQLGLRAHVFVVANGRARLVPVKTDRVIAGYVEIAEGKLSKGDRVIVTGNETLKDRGPVMVRAIRTPDGKVIAVRGKRPGRPAGKAWGGKPADRWSKPSGAPGKNRARQWGGKPGGAWKPGGASPAGPPRGKPDGGRRKTGAWDGKRKKPAGTSASSSE
jgi:HlyD family secretion protein